MISQLVRPVALALALSFATAATAEEFSSLEERMSAAEFKAAGLDKLSPEELARLNGWLRGKRDLSTGASAGVSEDRRGFYEVRSAGEDIVSRIAGEFRGWSKAGDRFELENGQVWVTTDSSSRLRIKVSNPTVTISEGVLGGWLLKVEGYNAVARVKRVK